MLAEDKPESPSGNPATDKPAGGSIEWFIASNEEPVRL